MGNTAENFAKQYARSTVRSRMMFAVGSQTGEAAAEGRPVRSRSSRSLIKSRKGDIVVDIRRNNPAPWRHDRWRLAKLRAAFERNGNRETPANASGINDGAAARGF